MATDVYEQITDKLNTSSHIVIVLPSTLTPDVLSAGLALKAFLAKLDKQSLILSPYPVPQSLSFLPGTDQVAAKTDMGKSFVLDVSTKRTQLAELSYQKLSDKISIFLKPKEGEFAPEDVTLRTSGFPYDLMVTIGVSALDQLNDLYAKNTELFFTTPIINIDHKGSNENYGQFNLVELTATSCSEIVLDLINRFEAAILDEHLATLLLTGIIAETNSFQHIRTTPQAFIKASQLIGLGAKQQEIVSKLYKNKSMGLLKLWGRVLARLRFDPALSLVTSAVSEIDVAKSQASNDDMPAIIHEMTSQLGFAKLFVFIKEAGGSSEVWVAASGAVNLPQALIEYQPKVLNSQTVTFKTGKTASETETAIIEKLRPQASALIS